MRGIKEKKGITLIALIITVIVMLILAGVAISVLTEDGRLFEKTTSAAEAYNQSVKNEADTMQECMNKIDEYLSGTNKKLIVGVINTEKNQTFYKLTTGTYSDPIVPKGFKAVETEQDSTITEGAKWGTADGYKYGLVIQDANGNQFVWVPVSDPDVMYERCNWNKGNVTYSSCSEIASSITNGGFYIARYEAGIATGMSKPTRDTTATYGNGEYKPVSKAGADVWNYIQWGTSNDENTPGNGAVTVAKNMYESSDNDYGVTSTLIYGTQWDTALKFIGAYNVGETGYGTYATNSTGIGNYSGTDGGDTTTETPSTCGALDAFKQKNIYDMAGNVWEWTMESYNRSYRVCRGGSYNGSGSGSPASYRSLDTLTDTSSILGFRVVLYIK